MLMRQEQDSGEHCLSLHIASSLLRQPDVYISLVTAAAAADDDDDKDDGSGDDDDDGRSTQSYSIFM